jgi:hypothetical protein
MIHSRCSPGTVQTTVPANAWVEYDVTTLLNSGDADYNFVLIPQSTDGMDTHWHHARPARRGWQPSSTTRRRSASSRSRRCP